MPMPWRGSVVEIPEDEVPKLLADDVNNVRVQGPEQSMPLSLRSVQDLAEFRSFQTGLISREVEDRELAENLTFLKGSGVKILGHYRGNRGEIGAYGAYNAVAGAIGVSLHSAILGEGLPEVRFPINSREYLDPFLNQVKLVEELFSDAPISEEARQRGRHAFHLVVHEDGYHPPSLKKGYSQRRLIEWLRYQIKVGEIVLKEVAKPDSPLSSANLALKGLRGPSGYDINLETARGLVQLGFEESLKPLDFLQKASELASPEDKETVTRRLGSVVLGDPNLMVPPDILQQARRGELSAREIKEIINELETHQKLETPKAEEKIETKEDLVIIGGEALEVDL